jgi:geranylgeranyl pyrophosphate synthase
MIIQSFVGSNEYVQSIAYEYGRHLGIAFQLIDDMLDFISHSDMLGKPTAIDMHLGKLIK